VNGGREPANGHASYAILTDIRSLVEEAGVDIRIANCTRSHEVSRAIWRLEFACFVFLSDINTSPATRGSVQPVQILHTATNLKH
jgi:hypothetical protein